MDALTELFEDFLTSDEEVLVRPRFVSAQKLKLFRSDVARTMNHPVQQHVDSHRIAFAENEALFYPKDPDDLATLSRSRTAVLQSLELSGGCVGSIVQQIQSKLDRPSGVSAYVSSPASRAFDWHFDQWESMIVQLTGRKEFAFKGLSSPLGDFRSIELNEGDVLFFRENIVHKTTTLETSVHLSFSVRR